MKKTILFGRVLYIGINKQRISFGMNVFHHNLETIKTTCLRQLHLAHKVYCKVFVYNTIACREKCQYVGYEMLFALVHTFPMLHVIRKINLLRCPETCLA